MNIDFLTLANHVSAFLESPYKPFLMFLPFVPWGWLISTKLDKDARYFHLNVHMWNGIHLGAGAAALATVVLTPIFWIGWPVSMLILITPILIYWKYRNDKVPDMQQYHLTGEGLAAKLEERKLARAAKTAVLQFTDAQGKKRPVPLKDDPLFSVHMLAEDLIGPAVEARATMVEVSVGANSANISQMVDGIRYKRPSFSSEGGLQAIDYIKDIAGLDVGDRRRRQTGAFSMIGPTGDTELVTTTAGSSNGVVLRVEFDRAERLRKPFDNLGMLPAQLEGVAGLTEKHDRHGIVLVGAPANNGLSTSIYSFIGRHDAYTSNIKTLEREVQLEIDGIDHVEFDPTNPDIDYPTALQSMLRRDPDVMMLGRLDDRESAVVAADPGMRGPLIYIPQRAPSIAEQIREWVKLVGDVKRATRALRAVSNQRLLRTLCPNCRQAYKPTAEQLKKLNLPASKVTQLFKAGGKVQVKNKIESCPVCGGSGYLGQTGIFEILVVDDEMRRILGSGDLKAALAQARRNKMIYLQEAALSKVASGDTTVEEVVRVTAPAKKGASGEGDAAPSAAAVPSASA